MPSSCTRIVLGPLLSGLLVTALAGCASVRVQGVSTNTGQAAYDLSGPTVAALAAQAERLCPQGHAVLRQWQRGNVAASSSDPVTDWLLRTGALSYDLAPEQAQMSIVCKA